MGVREEKYLARVQELLAFDAKFGTDNVAGMDEVGRGPLAGDVVAACVIMPGDRLLPRVDDSKKLSEKVRGQVAAQIRKLALFIGIGKASPAEIDEINILEATRLAMQRALQGCPAELLLVDAVQGLGTSIPTQSPIGGDAKSYAIACASVLAKVERDCDMLALHELYPVYDFAKNKGYGTSAHIAALQKYGPCPLHRRSFIKKFCDI